MSQPADDEVLIRRWDSKWGKVEARRLALEEQLRAFPSVHDTFKDKGVFITGASGFIGGLVVERILRMSPEVHGIYVLLRAKKGMSPEDRLQKEIIDLPVRTVKVAEVDHVG